jgi:hypothetical protein
MAEVFHIVPASGRALAFFGGLAILLLVLLALFAYFAYASLFARFEVTSEGLRIASALYGRSIPAASLIAEHARVVNLDQDSELRPRLRTNGIGMPGYSSGWFRLKRGDSALVFLTDRTRVVYLPTHEGYALLLSVQHPNEFIRAVRRLHGGRAS